MTPNAEFIYKNISALPVRELFAEPSGAKSITNLWELLVDGEKERFATLNAAKIDIPYEKMSDFERFSAFVSAVSRAWGSGARELFLEETTHFLGYDLPKDIPSASDMWRDFDGRMSEVGCVATKEAECCRTAHLPILAFGDDYGAWVERNLKIIEDASGRAVTLDISEMNFCITDRYHAEEAYKVFRNGSREALDVALSGLLFSVFEKARKSNICLFVNIGNRLESAKRMIDYLAERGVLSDLVLFGTGDIAAAVAAELCGVRTSGKRSATIECGILYRHGDTSEYIAKIVCDIARVYPVERLVIGGSLTECPAFAARHRVLRRGVCIAADRICPDTESALECARTIIENSAKYV